MVAPGGCMVAPGGHAWFTPRGACHGCSRGACMVAPSRGDMHGFSWGGMQKLHKVAWFEIHIMGGMHGCSWGGHAWLLPRGACMGYDI